MTTEHVYNGIRYTFSNENLKVGDKVYPIAHGRVLDTEKGGWILHNFDYMYVTNQLREWLNYNGYEDIKSIV